MQNCKTESFRPPMEEIQHLRRELQLAKQVPTTSTFAQSPTAPTLTAGSLNNSILNTSTTFASNFDSNKVNTRLKECFKERIAQYREAVYLLCGYKVELITDSSSASNNSLILKLRSMYAEDPSDVLLFKWRQDADLELMETNFASSLDENFIRNLKRSKSIPSFLSSVTLELFEKQTFMG